MIEDFLEDICSGLQSMLPQLIRCEPHAGRFDLDELKRIATRTPAVFVGWLGGPVGDPQGGVIDAELNLVAYVVTGGSGGTARNSEARGIVETMISSIPGQRWGHDDDASPAGDLVCENMYNGKIGRHGVALWAVAWRQEVRLTTTCN